MPPKSEQARPKLVRKSDGAAANRTKWARLPGRLLLILMAVAGPWMIGGIEGRAQLVLCLLALVALTFWWLEIAVLRPKHVIMPLSVLPILLGIGLGVMQFAPLPDSWAKSLGAGRAYQQWTDFTEPTEMDRELAEKMEFQSGVDARRLIPTPKKSISIDPQATRLMTAQLVLAAMCYLLGAHFFHDRYSLIWLCALLAINGVAIASFGMVQKMTAGANEIYFGALQVQGGVFGPYVNRNNACGLLLMCLSAAVMLVMVAFGDDREDDEDQRMMATHARRDDAWHTLLRLVHDLDAKRLATVFAVIAIIGGIVVSLSRGGTLAMLMGSAVAFVVIGMNVQRREKNSLLYLAMAVTLGLVLVAWLGFGEQILARFEEADQQGLMEQARVENWRDTSAVVKDQWLLGSGLNTYQHVHRALSSIPETGIYYFAENNYFQTLVDGGLVGAALLMMMLFWSAYLVSFLINHARSSRAMAVGLLGSFALASQCVAAFFDFGLYMPANMVTFAVLLGAIAGQAQMHAKRLIHSRHLAEWGLGPVSIGVILLLFGAGMLSLFEFHRLDQVEQTCMKAKAIREQKSEASLEEVESTLQRLSELAGQRSDEALHKATCELLVQRFQLGQVQALKDQFAQQQEGTLTAQQNDLLWQQTNPLASSVYLRQLAELNPSQARRGWILFRSDQELRANLLPAYRELWRARAISPLKPEIHARLAELGMVLSDLSPAKHLERAVQISPMNPSFQFIAGAQTLQSINFDSSDPKFEPAIDHLRKALELQPGLINTIQQNVVKRNILGAYVFGLDADVFGETLLMDYPHLLLNLVNTNPMMQENPARRKELLTQMAERVSKQQVEQRRRLDDAQSQAMGAICAELGDWKESLKHYEEVLRFRPAHWQSIEGQVNALIMLNRWDEAERQIQIFTKDPQQVQAAKRCRDRMAAERVRQAEAREQDGAQEQEGSATDAKSLSGDSGMLE